MELFRHPNSLRPKRKDQPIIQAESLLCLKGLLSQINDEANAGHDMHKDENLIKGINGAVVNTDDLSETYMLNCLNSSCDVKCVIVKKVDDASNSIRVLNPLVLDNCDYIT